MPVVKKAVDSAQRLTRYSRWVWNKYPVGPSSVVGAD